MPRNDLGYHFQRTEQLIEEMAKFVPNSLGAAAEFRADLAGLLVVMIVASYENCVKGILVNYAMRQHIAFGEFAENNYEKLNSRINISDLHKYAELFGEKISKRFKAVLLSKTQRIDKRLGKNIGTCYEQLLRWRHSFAHSGVRSTTIEEAASTHRFAKRVLFAFHQAFDEA
ncbi:MAG: HEPN domain-containing protein [Rhodospirillaceae bacterium]|nr:HEPN domain-containing protein [Rhodospirillaceae bacterium]